MKRIRPAGVNVRRWKRKDKSKGRGKEELGYKEKGRVGKRGRKKDGNVRR